MKNIEIKKMLQNSTKYCDEYIIKVWMWTDENTTWAEVICRKDGEWDCDNCCTFVDFDKEYEKLSKDEIKEMTDKMKKLSKYLEKHFENVELELELQYV